MSGFSPLFIANWKAKFSVEQELAYVQDAQTALAQLGADTTRQLVFCPSFLSLYPLKALLAHTGVALGAQSCSAFGYGAYTGEVTAASLAQTGCRYVLVGHSERRMLCHEDTVSVTKRVAQILDAGMVPVVCLGEDQATYREGMAEEFLAAQLDPVMQVLKEYPPTTNILLAYEPVWAIGTGLLPTSEYLADILTFLMARWQGQMGSAVQILYGGSVTAADSADLAGIPGVSGFLIGGASLDFQHLKKIVESWPR